MLQISKWVGLCSFVLWFLASGSFSIDDIDIHQAFPIVEPDPGHTKLRLSREGLEAIERITNPIAAVAVIGPYRSGKSFLLNQLLSLSCNEGFGVGHMRDTKTKGIWVWGTPIEMDINGVKTSVFYLDTEGFESVGKSNVYDDRIFALATVLSSVLIYNLPETIREADISRLSFAVELAEEFYGRVKGQDVAFEPAKLLWLIQRDFLQGKSVQQMVNEALQHVPNSDGDKNIDLVNQIRDSLAVMGDNSTAFSLPQPHLQRTKLCEMNDGDLDPLYVKRREQLKEVVSSIIRPKIVQGKTLTGKEFVSFLEQILEALNKGEIPSTGSLVEVFNKGILERCLKLYSDKINNLILPMTEEDLQGAHEGFREDAMKMFDEQHFGRHHAKKSVEALDEEIEKVHKNFILANEYQSSRICESLYTRCEDKMDELQVLKLPSMAKFNAGFLQCNQSFEHECVGPSKSSYEQRMMKMLGKSKTLFIKEYNHRLFNWLVAFSLVMVVVGRFIIKFFLVEIAAWILFIFLETYTRMFWSAESLYYNPVWHGIVASWETVVYSPILDLDRVASSEKSATLLVEDVGKARRFMVASLVPTLAGSSALDCNLNVIGDSFSKYHIQTETGHALGHDDEDYTVGSSKLQCADILGKRVLRRFGERTCEGSVEIYDNINNTYQVMYENGHCDEIEGANIIDYLEQNRDHGAGGNASSQQPKELATTEHGIIMRGAPVPRPEVDEGERSGGYRALRIRAINAEKTSRRKQGKKRKASSSGREGKKRENVTRAAPVHQSDECTEKKGPHRALRIRASDA
ncbi:OLC1v1007163C1 [Oldenlandia corymbosa var. corymbosa]|uniref:OLC1v1007163C1 n=1 Tax=Oldenlandia corymbosa var. corymbosa TaxID=529605 RepID=A0AAV1DIN9_OLDCO|nr:OLC1v1007163C1 [Oldenlandia corymbosa var. corymbosa]